jgi:predicted CXXCH cytochrome family protein
VTVRCAAIALVFGVLLWSHGVAAQPATAAQAPAAAQPAAAAARDAFRDDVHAAAGLTCESCHAGRADRPGAYDAPARTAIAPLCAKCHSDAAYMRQFDPQVRVDQFAQYLTSVHGKQMAGGDTRVATCSDCHSSHGVRRVRDARSPVAPLNAAATCARCHADEARMKPFGRDAAPHADWTASVHAAALLKRGDTSAPTCHTCHGSHGATPPGVSEVASVCAQCHVREAELFRASPKKDIFAAIGQSECIACHGNHRIEAPTDASVGLSGDAVCAQCHDESMGGARTILEMRSGLDRMAAAHAAAEEVLLEAERAGMLVDEGQAALRQAREHQVQARVLVHAFAEKPFADIAQEGVAAATLGQRAGEAAMEELQRRRFGLAIATLLIAGFLVTLWLKIRRLPEPPEVA